MADIDLFVEKIQATLGVAPAITDILPGRMVRFATCDQKGDDAGWCKLFDDCEGGVFGCWRQGISEKWLSESNRGPEEQNKFLERVKQAQAEAAVIEAEYRKECREKSADLWDKARDVDMKHPYLAVKAIHPFGIRQLYDSLLVPVRDASGTLHGLQFISPDGSKKFKSGTAVAGCYHAIGKVNGKILIAEGFATGATLHEITGHAVACAFSAGNLKQVAEALKKKYPDTILVICADDDYATEGNPGLSKATIAAQVVAALLAVPCFPDTRKQQDTDFNDLARLAGSEIVRNCIEMARNIKNVPAHRVESTEDADHWPEPIPLPDGLPPVKPLHPEMIPLPLRGWLMDIAERMQIPPDFSAAAAVVALGSIIGRGCGIHPKRHDDWLVVPNLWGAVVGRPSLMKTPAVSEAHRHLIRLESEAREAYLNATQEFEIDREIQKVKKSAITDDIKKAARKGNAVMIEDGREKLLALTLDEPKRQRFQTQDGTVEKIGELLNENPRGLLVNRDELIGWFRSLDRDGREGDRAFYLEAWNGNRGFTYDRIGRGTMDIAALCISIFGAITPGPLSSYVYQANRGGNGDDGLLQRFQVFVWPNAPAEWKNVDRFPDTVEKNRAWEIFKALSGDIPGAVMEEEAAIPALRFSPAGQEVFDSWRHELEMRLRSDHGLTPALESHLTKYRKLMPSLALIFHLVDVADGNEPGPVSEQAAFMATAWCDYLESHAYRLYGGMVAPGMEAAREIIRHINRGAIRDGATLREIWRPQWSKLTSSEEVKAGIEVLVEYDWLTVEKEQTGGRPTERIRLNPGIKF
jgi:putative DNA primase/helicase